MRRKEVLEKRLKRLQDKKEKLTQRALASQDANEVRSINEQLADINDDIDDVKEELEAIAEEEPAEPQDPAEPTEPAEPVAMENRSFNPVAAYSIGGAAVPKPQVSEEPTATMEYRQAFMNYVQRGEMSDLLTKQMNTRAATGTSADLGVLIPQTVVQEIIKGVEKVYGQLYSRVKKTNVPGGVKYPIGSFTATFKRLKEGNVSDRQNGGSVNAYVEFSYNIGEIRISQTILATILSVPAFENELSKVIVEAYVKAMDKEIMNGNAGNDECEGILTEAAKSSSRIPKENIIEFTEEEMADWTQWHKKLFAAIPLSMRSLKPEIVMTANTYEANIKTLKDANNRPVYNETFNPVDGAEIASFKGKTVVFVEDDILKDFDDAANGEYFGMYWVPEKAYAINSNLEFHTKRYFDDETNEWVNKALVINDGKILDPKYIYLLKKKITA